MSRHLNPTPPAGDRRRLDVAIAGVLGLAVVSATCGTVTAADAFAPHAHAPVTVAAPTAVDLREPTGHGGLGGPVTGPSFAADVPVWTEDKGPVIVNGQALAGPTVVAPEPEPEPIPEPSPTPTPVPEPPVTAATTAEPTPTPVVVVPEVTDPDVTPVETPAEPTVPVVAPGLGAGGMTATRSLHNAHGNPMGKRAILRMFALCPIYLPARDTVAGADLRTSMCDARAALTLAMGERPDIDGYAIPKPTPVEQLPLFEVAA